MFDLFIGIVLFVTCMLIVGLGSLSFWFALTILIECFFLSLRVWCFVGRLIWPYFMGVWVLCLGALCFYFGFYLLVLVTCQVSFAFWVCLNFWLLILWLIMCYFVEMNMLFIVLQVVCVVSSLLLVCCMMLAWVCA